MPNLGKDLTTSKFVIGKTNPQMVDFLKVGRPASDPRNTQGIDMAPRGGNPALTDTDLLNIIAYVRTMQAK
jgi:disulfide bond formation protein DsbB